MITSGKWILISSVGYIVGFALAVLLAEPFDAIGLGFFGLGLGLALGVSIAQALELRTVGVPPLRWMAASLAGLGGGYLVLNGVVAILQSPPLNLDLEGGLFMVCVVLASALGSYSAARLQCRYALRKAAPEWVRQHLVAWTFCSIWVAGYFTIAGPMHLERTAAGTILNILMAASGGPLLGYFTRKIGSVVVQ